MGMIDLTKGEADYLKYRFKQYLGSVSREIQNRRLKEQEDKCETCIYAWTDECPKGKCFENNYKYYVKEREGEF